MESRKTKALMERARWIQFCIKIGFATKNQIPKLEEIWDKFKDEYGNLKTKPC